MQDNIKLKSVISTFLLVICIFAIIVALGRVLVPFLSALILTYITNPFVEKIHSRFKIKRFIIAFAFSFTIFLVFISIPLFVIPALVSQIHYLILQIPHIIQVINVKVLLNINQEYGTNLTLDTSEVKNLLLSNMSSMYNNLNLSSPLAENSFIAIEILIYIVLIPFIMFYSILNWKAIISFFDEFIPKKYKTIIHNLICDIDDMLSSYLHGQITVMFIMAIYYATALHLIHVKAGILIGAVTGLLVFIPYLGVLSGLLITLVASFADFSDSHQILMILIAFAVGHVLEGALVTPFLIGGRIGLNPIMVIFALMVFAKLFGIIGVLLALATITIVVLRYIKAYYLKSNYYNEED